nr:DUF1836 domain-containing protein [uncultured Tyzzerella sp.]
MNQKDILEILKEYVNIDDVTLDKIPNIDLYMDQVTTFIDDSLKQYKRNDEQKIITKTMINNYTKDKILSSPNKKKYNKTHLISLILIYHLKSIISINDISLILKDNEKKIECIYDKFLQYKKISEENFYKDVENFLNIIENNEEDNISLIIFLINIINEANERKYLAEKIIDKYLKK